MSDKRKEKAKKIVDQIFKDLPDDNHIIDSVIKGNIADNKNLILEARTKCLSFEAWRAEQGKSIYNVVKSVTPGTKTAQKDFTKIMNKKEFLTEFISSVVKDFLKTDKKCKEFYKELSK